MAEKTLEIIITADNKAAIAAMQQTITSMNGVALAAGKTEASVKGMNTTYMNLGRVLQDLPYGFNGIANNLTQLIPSVGLAGIAFSGLVTAITFAQVGFGAWTRGMGGAKKELDAFNDSLTKEREGAEKSVSNLRALVSVAQDVALSTEKRKIAVEKLRSEYPGYFKDMTDEAIMTGDLTKVTDQLTTAIYKRAVATALVADISKKATQIWESENRAALINQQIKDAESKKATTSDAIIGSSEGIDISTSMTYGNRIISLKKDLNEELDKQHNLWMDIAVEQNKVNQITKETIDNDGKGKKAITDKIEKLKEWHQLQGSIRETIPFEATKGIDKEAKVPGRLGGDLSITANNILGYQENQEMGKRIQDTIALQQEQAAVITNTLAPAFDTLFQTMANGGDIGESLLNSFKQIAVQLTSMVIKALIFKAILSALKMSNPLTAGAEAAGNIAGGISGGLSIIGLLRGQDMQLMLDRTNTGNSYRRGG